MTIYRLEDAEEIGESLGLLALKFKRYTSKQKCISISCICFLYITLLFCILFANETPTNLRLSV